jgi:resuscitation-promoting factor RpfA
VRTRMLIASIFLAAFSTMFASTVMVTPAEAATKRTWERLANCESGGRWHINTGNGYYGGLQFSRSTWKAFGGRRFAHNAHRAKKFEQIKVAERVRRHQGWGAWPTCSQRIGVR